MILYGEKACSPTWDQNRGSCGQFMSNSAIVALYKESSCELAIIIRDDLNDISNALL